ncbi:MAG: glutamine synthetase III, partial [Clostridia bacterium]|nr:glutamine synthetase III [Clostridia bacterium]
MKSKNVMSTFAQNVFDYNKMKKYLPLKTYKAIVNTRENNGKLLPKDVEIYADALKKWALKKGVTRYTHWFQPLNNFTAEKRDSLTSLNKEGNAIVKFRGKELTTGEGDASSFPNGGMRQTFEARVVTNWDYTAFSFIKGDCLCIPTTFCGFNGEVLDKKTPLLNSSLALNKQALRILNLLQFKCGRVRSVVGAEQEYFLIKKSLFDKRRDLVYTGRTLFGAEPCKGQESDGHYFRPPTDDVLAFMRDVDDELWKLGIIVKTEHNEVAPCQCELAPCYSDAN